MARRRKLGTLAPARYSWQERQERALYDATCSLFRRWQEYVWPHLGLPGDGANLAALPPQYTWAPSEQAEFDKACRWFLDGMMGQDRYPDAFSDPSTAYIDLHNPIYDGKPILPGQMRTSFSVGVDRAVQIVGADAPRLLGIRGADAQRELLRIAFERLSDGAAVKLADVLNGDENSVKSMLHQAIADGQNPLKTARELQKKFSKIEGYDWARLARTETAFAQCAGIVAEYRERGYVDLVSESGETVKHAPYHPNCVCGVTILPEDGFMFPDVATTACPACQAQLALANAILATRRRGAA